MERLIKLLDYYTEHKMTGSRMYKMLYHKLLEQYDYDYEKERA